MNIKRSHETAMNHMDRVSKELIADPQTKSLGATYANLMYEAKQLWLAAELVRRNYQR